MNDIIKNSILEAVEGNTLSMWAIYVTLGTGILFSLYIYGIYYLSQKKGFYNKQFNVVLGVLPIITAGIILAMQSNLVISLGMVGALSIVRFRTAVKEPKDLLSFLVNQRRDYPWGKELCISFCSLYGSNDYAVSFGIAAGGESYHAACSQYGQRWERRGNPFHPIQICKAF